MTDDISENGGSIMVIRHKVVMVGDIYVGNSN